MQIQGLKSKQGNLREQNKTQACAGKHGRVHTNTVHSTTTTSTPQFPSGIYPCLCGTWTTTPSNHPLPERSPSGESLRRTPNLSNTTKPMPPSPTTPCASTTGKECPEIPTRLSTLQP